MNLYFSIKIQFNREVVISLINQTIYKKEKGYVCVVDGNVLANSVKDIQYRAIINNSLVNCCDGSSIALLAGIIHRVRFNTYTGPEVFAKFTQEPFRQLFLGNTSEVHNLLHSQFRLNSIDTSQMFFETLPFKNVDEFEYDEIAKRINSISPDIIWVSLGAPKQEYFIHKLYPFIDKGIFIAIGAAFNFYINTNHNRRAPSLFLRLKLEWLYRSLKDPKRIGRRAISYALLLPSIIVKEIFKVYFKGKNKS